MAVNLGKWDVWTLPNNSDSAVINISTKQVPDSKGGRCISCIAIPGAVRL